MTSISASFMEHGWCVELHYRQCVCDRDTGLGVGFLRGFGDDSDTVSSTHQLMFPVRCSDNTKNTGRDAVLPAARCF